MGVETGEPDDMYTENVERQLKTSDLQISTMFTGNVYIISHPSFKAYRPRPLWHLKGCGASTALISALIRLKRIFLANDV